MTQSAALPAPDPVIVPESAAFWDGTRRGEFLVGACTACDEWFWPPTRDACPHCGADAELRAASGLGTLYSWTAVARGSAPYPNGYVVAYVQLAEGPTLLTNVVGIPIDDLQIGMELTLRPAVTPSGVALPRFGPIS